MAEEVVVKAKEILYRGKPIEELKNLSVREVAKYLPSRSRRSVLRNFQTIEKFLQRCQHSALHKKKIRTHLRDIIITPKLVGLSIGVYNGKAFTDVLIAPQMIGHRLGEFALTRSRVVHGEAGIGATKSSRADKK